MRIVGFAAGEQRLERVICWKRESGGVDKELAGNVKEDEEEVQGTETEHDVDFRDARLLLEVVEGWVLGQFPVRWSVFESSRYCIARCD